MWEEEKKQLCSSIRLICQLVAEPFLNRLAATFALDTAIEQTQTDTKREPHNRRDNA
jgi:hypothetical protein